MDPGGIRDWDMIETENGFIEGHRDIGGGSANMGWPPGEKQI